MKINSKEKITYRYLNRSIVLEVGDNEINNEDYALLKQNQAFKDHSEQGIVSVYGGETQEKQKTVRGRKGTA